MQSYTVEQVQAHNTANDCWIIVDGKVFDVTQFLSVHPGGKKVLVKKAGQDASKEFKTFHNESIMQRVGIPMQIGVIASAQVVEEPKKQQIASQPVTEKKHNISTNALVTNIDAKFGENLPYGDPSWYQEWNR
jgi:cytochrome b involved in lipid metabolism